MINRMVNEALKQYEYVHREIKFHPPKKESAPQSLARV